MKNKRYYPLSWEVTEALCPDPFLKVEQVHEYLFQAVRMWRYMHRAGIKENRPIFKKEAFLRIARKEASDNRQQCFLCHLSKNDCAGCPVIWSGNEYMHGAMDCMSYGSPFSEWYDRYACLTEAIWKDKKPVDAHAALSEKAGAVADALQSALEGYYQEQDGYGYLAEQYEDMISDAGDPKDGRALRLALRLSLEMWESIAFRLNPGKERVSEDAAVTRKEWLEEMWVSKKRNRCVPERYDWICDWSMRQKGLCFECPASAGTRDDWSVLCEETRTPPSPVTWEYASGMAERMESALTDLEHRTGIIPQPQEGPVAPVSKG